MEKNIKKAKNFLNGYDGNDVGARPFDDEADIHKEDKQIIIKRDYQDGKILDHCHMHPDFPELNAKAKKLQRKLGEQLKDILNRPFSLEIKNHEKGMWSIYIRFEKENP